MDFLFQDACHDLLYQVDIRLYLGGSKDLRLRNFDYLTGHISSYHFQKGSPPKGYDTLEA